eukprot:1155418-Pelagomonas_calceolata.AAC.4
MSRNLLFAVVGRPNTFAPLSNCLPGKYYAINVPLKDGTTDDTFHALFQPVMRKVVETFQPGAIVMQCGTCLRGVFEGAVLGRNSSNSKVPPSVTLGC